MTELDGWTDSATTTAIRAFVDRVTRDGPDYVEPADRIAPHRAQRQSQLARPPRSRIRRHSRTR